MRAFLRVPSDLLYQLAFGVKVLQKVSSFSVAVLFSTLMWSAVQQLHAAS